MVELLVNKYKHSGDNANSTLPCLRRRTRRRDSIQCMGNARPQASSATDNVNLMNNNCGSDAQLQVQVDQDLTEQSRCYTCA